MSTNWRIIGNGWTQDKVTEKLNEAGVGIGVFVSLNEDRNKWNVWGDDKSIVFPDYEWKSIYSGTSQEDLTKKVEDSGAVSATVGINTHNVYVLWGYVPA